jgi:hypothetical protein
MGQSELRNQIEAYVQQRWTGLLKASSGSQTCTIAFLFGHVFHAECGALQGEDALRLALSWNAPLLSYNARAQLPVKETITRPITAILEAA